MLLEQQRFLQRVNRVLHAIHLEQHHADVAPGSSVARLELSDLPKFFQRLLIVS